MKKFFILCIALLAFTNACADCVVGAKSKTHYQVLDTHTILLSGGGNHILIKSFSFFYSSSQVSVLKDNFCDFEIAVLYVDGQVVDVQQVKSI